MEPLIEDDAEYSPNQASQLYWEWFRRWFPCTEKKESKKILPTVLGTHSLPAARRHCQGWILDCQNLNDWLNWVADSGVANTQNLNIFSFFLLKTLYKGGSGQLAQMLDYQTEFANVMGRKNNHEEQEGEPQPKQKQKTPKCGAEM